MTHNRIRAIVIRLVGCACTALGTINSALAADSAPTPWSTPLPSHAAWTLLAGIGLVAVAIAALSVRRPQNGDTREDDSTVNAVHAHEPASEPAQREQAERGSASDDVEPPHLDVEPRIETTVEPVAESLPEPAVEVPANEAALPLPVANDAAPNDDALPQVVRKPGRRQRTAVDTPSRARASNPAALPNGSQLFLALHHVDMSIEVLRRHLEREPRPMPAAWLMLLDLCRTHGREQTFCEIALEFHRRFNVRTPAWEGFPPGRDEPGLEAYPRLVKEITLTWGTHECARLLDRLLYDTRKGERRGFTLNAYNDLIALRRAAGAVLESIEEDLSEEARVRSAFDSATAAANETDPLPADRSPLVQDLESQLEGDLRASSATQSAIEREHPALAGMLAREWGNAALSARLCEMLARGGDGMQPLSPEAAEELALLRTMAERLSASTGVPLPGTAVVQAS